MVQPWCARNRGTHLTSRSIPCEIVATLTVQRPLDQDELAQVGKGQVTVFAGTVTFLTCMSPHSDIYSLCATRNMMITQLEDV